jgi:hypothetical protein
MRHATGDQPSAAGEQKEDEFTRHRIAAARGLAMMNARSDK